MPRSALSLSLISLSVLFISSCVCAVSHSKSQIKESKTHLKESLSFDAVPAFLENEPNLRKWDSPVVADLDQDGFMDLLLNDHGFSVKIVWNNKGTFAPPYDLLVGDLHGVSIDDFDNDGQMEVILSKGGGSGSNARNSTIFKIDKFRNIAQMSDFNEPLANMRGRTVNFVDLNKDGHADLLNFAFPSANKKGQSENYIYENTAAPNFQLKLKTTLPSSKRDGQKVLLSDFNADGYPDIFMYGDGALKIYQGGANFSFSEVTNKVLNSSIEHITGAVQLDYDNDGDLDIYFSRGKAFERGQTFFNPETRTMAFYTKRGPFDFVFEDVGDVLKIENMQSQWPSKHVFIGESGYEYEFPGETHSGRNIRLVNSDALGFAQKRDKKGTYIGYVGNKKWRIAGDIWSPFTAVLHDVPHYAASPILPGIQDVFLENQKGVFVDRTQSLGLDKKAHTMGVAKGDLNNDGLIDLIVMPRGNMVDTNAAIVYLNNSKGFTQWMDHGIESSELGAIGMAIDALDYNLDGNLDVIIGSDRGKWRLFKSTNQGKPGFTVKLGRSPKKNGTVLGAKVQLEACGLKQTRILGSNGASYSYSANRHIHFGLADCKSDLHVEVNYSNAERISETVKSSDGAVAFGRF